MVGESRIAMWFVITAAVSLYIEAGVRSLRVGGKKHVVPFSLSRVQAAFHFGSPSAPCSLPPERHTIQY